MNPTDPTEASLRAAAALMDAVLPVMHKAPEQPVKVAELDPLMREILALYAGGPDGPIREPGDDMPSDSDVMSHDEIVAALDLHAASLAKRGVYGIATDLGIASRAFDKLAAENEALHDTIQDLRDKLTHHGLTDCERDVGCLLYADHAGHCVTSFAERDRIRRDEDAAERGNDVE